MAIPFTERETLWDARVKDEVAEQLSDFHGLIKSDGSRDLLRKHLDRIAVMEKNKALIAARLGLNSTPDLRGYIVFRNPVPMEFAWEEMKAKIDLLILDQLESLRISESRAE